jgi:hypothetical protein
MGTQVIKREVEIERDTGYQTKSRK